MIRRASFICCLLSFVVPIILQAQSHVNLFIASELDWKEKGFKLKQETTFPETGKMKFSILQSPALPMGLQIRYPSWAVNGALLKVNGKVLPVKQKPGSYLLISRKWKVGDNVEVDFPIRRNLITSAVGYPSAKICRILEAKITLIFDLSEKKAANMSM